MTSKLQGTRRAAIKQVPFPIRHFRPKVSRSNVTFCGGRNCVAIEDVFRRKNEI